ncbi:MAG: thiamine-phosphate kinase [Burkholderiaceae bacterium]|nr:thiamine-phosphate kinase [Burkholderiaceae bacterium]MEB2350984.1 thiamine-phosphate kinase [Burkholderiaceae bacterium]
MPLGEFGLIARFFDRGPARQAILGVGDDCALLAPAWPHCVTAVSTDMLLAGRHFLVDDDPVTVGHKALAVNLSDLAAMGAQPRAFTLALAVPQVDETWLGGFCTGLFAIADRYGCELVGGDTTRGPITICITVFGEVPPEAALRRDAAQPDDDLWVSGTLGAAALAVGALAEGRPRAPGDRARLRLERPEPRVALGLALRHVARAAIDLSDGLVGDLGHILDRSRAGAEVDWSAVPVDPGLDGLPESLRLRLALAGGDDYELLFSAAPENRGAIEAIGRRLDLPLARIGRIVAGAGLRIHDARGRPLAVDGHGFDHFA